ncbi:MAG TPA: nucleotidyltransferase family protein [Vicinamibacterales bacterium]
MPDVMLALGRMLAGAESWNEVPPEVAAQLATAAEDHGVSALLWSALAGVDGADALRQQLTPTARAAVAREVFVHQDLRTITEALAADGIHALVVKGSALAYTCYPQPWLRPRTDTDLLVPLEQVTAAARVLRQCGYTRSDATNTGSLVSHQVSFEREDDAGVGHVIDLHWKLANPRIVADTLRFDDLWPSSRSAPDLGSAARVPGVVGSLAIACVHRLAHHQGHDRLVWLYDIHLLAASLSDDGWEEMRDFARSREIAGLCLDGLRAARAALGCELPADIEAALDEAAAGEPSRIYLERQVTRSDVLVSDLKLLRSWNARLRLLREHVLPPVAFIHQRYGTRTRMLLPALYLHRLITGASKWVRS